MKQFCLFTLLLFVVSCTVYDDSEIKSTLQQHESRLAQLESICSTLNSDISSLRNIIDALEKRDYVTGVSPYVDNGVETGYIISFANSNPFVIRHGNKGADGVSPIIGIQQSTDGKYYWTLNGTWLLDGSGNKLPVKGESGITPKLKIQDGFWYVSYDDEKSWVKAGQATGDSGYTPVIGARQHTDGKYYWTLDGNWLPDANGDKIPVKGESGISPKLKIQDGFWYVSYDNEKTWEKAGQATGDRGDSLFKSIMETDEAVVMVLTDGTIITLEKMKALGIQFNTEDGLGILPGEKRSIGYTITGGTESTIVKAIGQNGWRAKVIAESAAKGLIEIQAPAQITNDEIIILVSDGESRTIVKTLAFEEGVIESDVQSVILKGGGETISIDIESNLPVSVKSSASWLNCELSPATRALTPYTLKLSASKNLTDNERAATVNILTDSGSYYYSIAVIQNVYDEFEHYVDLSGGGETANCYLINKAGEYMFPIIKGNGARGVIISGDTAEIPDAAGAKIVWQTTNIIESVGIHKGFVVFETTQSWKTGNAVIAVTDADGTILWSWHIWSTGYVLGQNDIPVYNHSRTIVYNMMATSLGEIYGDALFYQFGRKDPFPHYSAENVGSAGSLEASIQQPDVFFSRSGSDWCTSSRTDWWDAGCKSNNSSSTSPSTLKGNKTIYDPCPAGYRVPPDDAFTNFTTTGTNTESSSAINSPNVSSFFINDNSYSFYTGSGSKTITFKAMGGLNAATGKLLTYVAYYYGAHPSGYSTSRLLQFMSGSVSPQNTAYSRALAANIRPIRDEVQGGGGSQETVYESTDYSQDGTTVQIMKHSVGSGIKVLIVGDGFTDKDIANGNYDKCMNQASQYFFNIEPYKSFKNRFDVINMRVVSKTSVFDSEKRTAFQAVYAGGSHITGNLSAAYNRAIQVFGSIQDVLIIVVMNSDQYAGTCYMAGNTVSVAFCPMSTGTYYPFETVIHHEAGGHGFAFLGDEYSKSGTIPESEKDNIASGYSSYGWYYNLDCTSNRNSIRWAKFLSDSYYSTVTGIYEGGYGYSSGVYRPTSTSCMNNMYGEFNAPSRYAIYKRIMELSGDTWSWDKFVSYDTVNKNAATSSNAYYPMPDAAQHHCPPIAVNLEDYITTP